MKWIAILPVKEHSARVPHKNFRVLNGKPLWEWTARKLLGIPTLASIVIDTDCQELFAGLPAGPDRIVVRARPQCLRGDDVSMNCILEAVVAAHPADAYLQVHATNPFVPRRKLVLAMAWLEDKLCGSIHTVTEHRARFFFRGQPVNHDPEELLKTQDLPPVYEENSCLYAFERAAFLLEKRRVCGKKLFFVLPPIENLDIDTEAQWQIAEALVEHAAKRGEKPLEA